MRILAGIPTKGRTTSDRVAEALSPFVERVLIVAQQCHPMSGGNIEVRYEEPSLLNARNIIVQEGIAGGYDGIMMCDDDIVWKQTDTPAILIAELERHEELGAISTLPEMFKFWRKGKLESNKSYQAEVYPFQFYVIRTQALKETGSFRLPLMEDIELGLRIWRYGWVVGSHRTLAHSHTQSRMSIKKIGGIEPEELDQQTPECCAYIENSYRDTIKFCKPVKKDIGTRFRIRYRWEELANAVTARWGNLDYEDNRMKF